MDIAVLRRELRELIVSALNLEGKDPADIDEAAPLFGEGLGLDSLDALELAMAVEERYGVRLPDGEEAKTVFASVHALADHISRAPRQSDKGGEPTAG